MPDNSGQPPEQDSERRDVVQGYGELARRLPKRHEVFRISLAYMFLASLAMFQMFMGRVYFSEGMVDQFYPWRYAVAGLESKATDLQNPWLFDSAVYVGPQDFFIKQCLDRREFPLWNPRLFCGHPIAANAQSEMFYPIHLAVSAFFDFDWAHNIYLWLHLWMAATVFYCYTRLWAARGPSFVAGLLWMLQGFMAVLLESKAGVIGVCIPAVVLGTELLVNKPSIREALRLGCIGGFLLVCSHKQYTYYAFFLAGIYFWYLCLIHRGDGLFKQRLKRVFVALSLAFCLGAPLVLPFLELASHSHREPNTTASVFEENRFYPEHLLTLFLPEALSSAPGGFCLSRNPRPLQFPTELTYHLGVVGMLLAICGLTLGGLRARFFGAFGIYLLLSTMFPPLYSPLHALPGFQYLTPCRILMLMDFAFCVLAALALERLSSVAKKVKMGVPMAVYSALAVFTLWWLEQARSVSPTFVKVLDFFFRLGGHRGPNYAPMAEPGRDFAERALSHYQLTNPSFWLPLLCGMGFFLSYRYLKRSWFLAATGVFIFAELTLFLNHWNPTTPVGSTFPETPVLSMLKSSPYRLVGVGRVAQPNLMSTYCSIPEGYDSLRVGEYGDFFSFWQSRSVVAADQYQMLFSRPTDPIFWRWASLVGVKYAYTDPFGSNLFPPDWKLVYDRELKVYENPEEPLRAWVVSDWKRVSSQLEALNTMAPEQFDYRKTATVEAELAPPSDGGPGKARITHYSPNEVIVETESGAAGVLVLNDVFYPGWYATVDGKAAPVFRADGIFRGVYLEPGSHTVRFSFFPKSLSWGIALALLGIIGAIALWRRPESQESTPT